MKFIAGNACLDFVNTVGGRDASGKVLRDKLVSYGDVLAFGEGSGLLSRREAGRLPGNRGAALARARRLREALYRIFTSRKPQTADLALLNREVLVARRHQRLAARGGRLEWEWDDGGDRVLWSVVQLAAELLTSGDLGKLRQCGGRECGWLFLDTSRNHSRQWCDMKDCGNLAKVRRFREKARSG